MQQEQIRNVATENKLSKLRLIAELLESNRIISEDNKQIFSLGEEVKRLRKALEEIIELSEGSPSSYRDFGDIAREALRQ
jgi:hypothetical protein